MEENENTNNKQAKIIIQSESEIKKPLSEIIKETNAEEKKEEKIIENVNENENENQNEISNKENDKNESNEFKNSLEESVKLNIPTNDLPTTIENNNNNVENKLENEVEKEKKIEVGETNESMINLKNIKNEINEKNKIIQEIDNKLDDISNNLFQQKNVSVLDKIRHEKNSNVINSLQNRSNIIESNIYKLNKIQNELENESYLNVNDNSSLMHKIRLNQIKNEKSILQSKLNEINNQINSIVFKENQSKNNKASIIKNFLDNFESDREKYSNKIKKLSEQSRKRRDKYENYLKETENKNDLNYLNNKEKEEQRKKMQLQLFKAQQRKVENERREENNKKMQLALLHRNGSPSTKDKNYITAEEREQMRQENEKALLSLELAKRKAYYKPINKEELDDFSKKYNENKKHTNAELEHKKLQMEELYKERKQLLPKYHSKFFLYNKQLDKEYREEKEKKLLEIKKMNEVRRLFDKDVKKIFFPTKTNEKLKKEREDRIKTIAGDNRKEEIKRLNEEIKNKREEYKVPKVKVDPKKKIDIKKEELEKKKEKREKEEKIEKNKKDYLKEFRMKREEKIQKNLINTDNLENNQWKKIMNNNKKNFMDNIDEIKNKAEKMQREAEYKQKLYKMDNNAIKHPEMSDEIGNLYVQSIQGKLEILNSLNRRDEE